MTETTPNEIRKLIEWALTEKAATIRREAASHRNTGPGNTRHRANLREEAGLCEQLATVVGAADPQKLAEVLGTHGPLLVATRPDPYTPGHPPRDYMSDGTSHPHDPNL